jgi:hypothetical protein
MARLTSLGKGIVLFYGPGFPTRYAMTFSTSTCAGGFMMSENKSSSAWKL